MSKHKKFIIARIFGRKGWVVRASWTNKYCSYFRTWKEAMAYVDNQIYWFTLKTK